MANNQFRVTLTTIFLNMVSVWAWHCWLFLHMIGSACNIHLQGGWMVISNHNFLEILWVGKQVVSYTQYRYPQLCQSIPQDLPATIKHQPQPISHTHPATANPHIIQISIFVHQVPLQKRTRHRFLTRCTSQPASINDWCEEWKTQTASVSSAFSVSPNCAHAEIRSSPRAERTMRSSARVTICGSMLLGVSSLCYWPCRELKWNMRGWLITH